MSVEQQVSSVVDLRESHGVSECHLAALRQHCGLDPDRWAEACWIALVASGWTLSMLRNLHVYPADTWIDLIDRNLPQARRHAIPGRLQAFAERDPVRWGALAMRTLRSRGWSLPMIGRPWNVVGSTVGRTLERLEQELVGNQ